MFPGFLGVLHGLPGKFVTAQVVAFAMMLGCSLVCMGGEKVELGSALMGVFHASILLGKQGFWDYFVNGTKRRTATSPRPSKPARMASENSGTAVLECSDLLEAKEVPLISSRVAAKPFEGRLRLAAIKAIAINRIMMTHCRRPLTHQQSGNGSRGPQNHRSTVLRTT